MATTKIPQELLEKTSITFADGEILNFGTDNDLQIYSSGSYSFIREVGTGGLYLDTNGDGIYLRGTTGNENMVKAIKDGAVELYHNGIKKFYTGASGVDIVGTAALTGGITVQDDQVAYFGTGLDLRISHVSSSGSNLIQSYTSGELVIESNGNTKIRTNNADDMAKFLKNGAVELYYDNVKKFETTSTGITVTGAITSNDRITGDGSESVPAFRFATDTNTGMFPPAGGDVIGFATGGAERVRIDSSGNVGIGTNSPAHPLHVYEDGGYYLSFDRGNSTPGGPDPWLGLFNNVLINNATYGWGFYDSNSDGSLQLWNKNNSTTGYNTFTIKRGGNVGIGTASPSSKLHVKHGDIRLEGNAESGQDITFTITNDNSGNEVEAGLIRFIDTGGGQSNRGAAIASYMPTADTGDLRFYTSAGADRAERMRIYRNGNVGIGTTGIPAAKLHISGNSDVSDENCQLIIDDVDGSAGSRIPSIQFRSVTGGTTTNQGRIRATDTQGMILSGSSAQGDDLVVQAGKVGIGTTNPLAPLNIQSDSGANGIRIAARSGNDHGFISFYANNNTDIWSEISGSAGTLRFYTGSTVERLRIDGSGNVGIGENSPDRRLHVNSGTTNVVAKFESTDGTTAIEFTDSGGSAEIGCAGDDVVLFPAGTEKFRVQNSTGYLVAQSASQVRLVLGSTGNSSNNTSNWIRGTGSVLGLNSAGGNVNIEIGGNPKVNVNPTGQILANSLGVTTPTFAFINDTNTGMTRPTGDTLQLVTAGVERLRISSTGVVGVGGSSALQTMHSSLRSAATTFGVKGPIGSGYPMGEGTTQTEPRIYRDWFMYNSGSSIGSDIYVHMKTDLWAGGSPAGNTEFTMSCFTYNNYYSYGGSQGQGSIGWHNWSGSYYNVQKVNNGSLDLVQSSYTSSDGYVVLVAKIGAGYAQFSIDWAQWGGYGFRERKVTAVTRTSSANGAY